jgi:hypothetical protein
MKTWTDDLILAINALSYATGREEPPCDLQKYNKIVHLTWVPTFVNLINPYRESPTDKAPMLLITTPSQLSVVNASAQTEEDTDHPGNDWMLYDSTNPAHYQLLFSNKLGQAKIAKYICYISVRDGMAVQGCHKKGDPIYGMALHARAYPHPNFHSPSVKDTNLTIFHPSSVNCRLVDDALIHLTDAGVVADVHMLCAQINKKQNIKRQQLELDGQEREAEGKMLLVEQYLIYARARSRL